MFVYECRSGAAEPTSSTSVKRDAFLRDDEQAPEERAAFDRVRHPHVERLLEHDALRHDDEEPVLPDRGVVRGELLLPADERVETLVLLGQRRERDPLGCAVDRDAGFGDRRQPGHVELEHRLDRTRPRDCPLVVSEGVRVEALEVREAPVLFRRVRKRQLSRSSRVPRCEPSAPRASSRRSTGRSGDAASARCRPGRRRRPCGRHRCRASRRGTPRRRSSSLARASATSATRKRDRVLVDVELHPGLLGNHDRQRDVPGLELGPVLVRQLIPLETERLPVELQRSFLVSRGQRHEIRALDVDRQPTDPSICSWINRFISTAYSSGSSFVIGSTKPETISAEASDSVRPRDMR